MTTTNNERFQRLSNFAKDYSEDSGFLSSAAKDVQALLDAHQEALVANKEAAKNLVIAGNQIAEWKSTVKRLQNTEVTNLAIIGGLEAKLADNARKLATARKALKLARIDRHEGFCDLINHGHTCTCGVDYHNEPIDKALKEIGGDDEQA